MLVLRQVNLLGRWVHVPKLAWHMPWQVWSMDAARYEERLARLVAYSISLGYRASTVSLKDSMGTRSGQTNELSCTGLLVALWVPICTEYIATIGHVGSWPGT